MLTTLPFFPLSFLIVSSVSAEVGTSKCNQQIALAGGQLFWDNQLKNFVERIGDFEMKRSGLICELSNRQRMVEAIFGTLSEDSLAGLGDASSIDVDECECLRRRLNLIAVQDPALRQVLNGIFVEEMNAKRTLQSSTVLSSDANAFLMVKRLKQSLGFALTFLAKRYQIQLSNPAEKHFDLTKNNLKYFLEDLIGFLEKPTKCGQSCGGNCATKNCTKKNRKADGNDHSRGRRFVQFAFRATEIDWEGTALLTAQKKGNGRRRRRRINLANSMPFLILFMFMLILLCLLVLFCQNAVIIRRNLRNQSAANAPAVVHQQQHLASSQMNSKYLDAFKRVPSVVVGTQKGNGEEQQQLDCAICLGTIDYGTKVRPLPVCKHMFHTECIEMWLQGGHNACPVCRQEVLTVNMLSSPNGGTRQNDGIEIVIDERAANVGQEQTTDHDNNSSRNRLIMPIIFFQN